MNNIKGIIMMALSLMASTLRFQNNDFYRIHRWLPFQPLPSLRTSSHKAKSHRPGSDHGEKGMWKTHRVARTVKFSLSPTPPIARD